MLNVCHCQHPSLSVNTCKFKLTSVSTSLSANSVPSLLCKYHYDEYCVLEVTNGCCGVVFAVPLRASMCTKRNEYFEIVIKIHYWSEPAATCVSYVDTIWTLVSPILTPHNQTRRQYNTRLCNLHQHEVGQAWWRHTLTGQSATYDRSHRILACK